MTKWERPPCNNCHNKKYRVFLDSITSWEHKGRFRLVKCSRCGLVFLNPRPTKRYIANYYPKKTYWNSKEDPKKAYGYLYKMISKEKKNGKILDIGAGNGLFLAGFNKKKWKRYGVELSDYAVGLAGKEFGIKLKKGDFLDLKFRKNFFDVITLNNVLEHLYRPQETLNEISKILEDSGTLIVSLPNLESIGARVFRKNWLALQPPRHLYQFTPTTITEMLRRSGFNNIKIYHNYWVHNFYSLFESFRFVCSPKFRKADTGGLAFSTVSDVVKPSSFSVVKEIGKIFANVFAKTIAFIEPYWEMGEVITIYAKKT